MEVLEQLGRVGAVLHDQHIVLASGRHGSDYINLDYIFPDSGFMSMLGHEMADVIDDTLQGQFDALVAPATGGVALLQWVGFHLRGFTGEWQQLFWADKQADGSFAFERADWAKSLEGMIVVGIEDIVTTGGSLKKTMDAAVECGAIAAMAMAVCNRGGATAEQVGAKKFLSLTEVDFPTYEADDCPLCQRDVPIVEDLARGAQYKLAHPNYPGGYVKLLS